MDPAERKDTAQQALVYVGIAVAVVVVLVLLWYAINVVLLAFIGVLLAILLRAPADWLTERTGMREGWSLALVGVVALALLVALGALFGRGVASQALQLVDRIPQIVQTIKEQLSESELGAQAVSLIETSGAFAGGEVPFLSRGLGLIGSTFGAIANLLIVVFFAAFMAAQPRLYIDGLLFLVARKRRPRRQVGEARLLIQPDRAHEAIPLVVARAPAREVLGFRYLDAQAAALPGEAQILRRVAAVSVGVAALLPVHAPAIGLAERPRGATREQSHKGDSDHQSPRFRMEPIRRSHSKRPSCHPLK
jgi:hypothetical protein